MLLTARLGIFCGVAPEGAEIYKAQVWKKGKGGRERDEEYHSRSSISLR